MPDPLAPLAIQKDLRAVVTAGAGSIGCAIADALIANGARVLVSDVDLHLSLEFRNINSR